MPMYNPAYRQYAIETEVLTKRYGPVLAVDRLDLRVPVGELYGFLGLNGAGKTTTIRALLGMIAPTEGSVHLFGLRVGRYGQGPWERVGHLVETAVAYPDLTVRENLEIARRLYGLRDSRVVDRFIDLLKLEAYASRKAGTLSLGNLQRLGLARAMLHSPDLLILDEPANGLDPAGVVEIREMLAALVRERGVTILMSSHILTEVDRLATRIGIIHEGRLIEELDSGSMERLRNQRLVVKTRDPEATGKILQETGYAAGMRRGSESIELFDRSAIEAPDEVARLLVNAGIPLLRLAIEQEDLEDHFLRLTGASQ
jgi:ABC-2 type transport system ATP-binding protein